jgi:hypothetical protein
VAIFNGSLEVAVRIALILEASYPESLDVDQLALLDHALLHSADFGGPESVFPAVPGRVSELALKRPLIKAGLHILSQALVVQVLTTHRGVVFLAGEEMTPFVGLLDSPLAGKLRTRARWAVGAGLGVDAGAKSRLTEAMAGWRHEFGEGVR